MDSQIQGYLRFAASHERNTERIGPFLATFSPHNDNPFLNYAIPDDVATPSSADVAALITAYERRSRIPRLEYIAHLAPDVEGALLTAGFVVEGRLELMTCIPGSEQILPLPPDIELVVPVTDLNCSPPLQFKMKPTALPRQVLMLSRDFGLAWQQDRLQSLPASRRQANPWELECALCRIVG